MKQWNRFPINVQQRLTSRYQVILTDHKTRKERIMSAFTVKNLNSAISRFNGMVDQFSMGIDSFGKEMSKMDRELKSSRKDYSALLGNKRDYSFLTGRR